MAPCDEILNLERSSGIPLGGTNASHWRYKTAGKLLSFLPKEPSKPGLTEQSNLLPTNCKKEGQIVLNSSLNPDFGDCHSRPTSAATPDVKAQPFCQIIEQDNLSLILNHGLGGWKCKNLSQRFIRSWCLKQKGLQPAFHTQNSAQRKIFHLSCWSCPTQTSTRRVTGVELREGGTLPARP